MRATVLRGQAEKSKWNETGGVEGERLRRVAGTRSSVEVCDEVVLDGLWRGEGSLSCLSNTEREQRSE